VPVIRGAAEAAGRPEPTFSARIRVSFEKHETPFYMLNGDPEAMIAELRQFESMGVSHVAVDFAETIVERHRDLMERFDREVAAAFR
jgi:hypothetical protein